LPGKRGLGCLKPGAVNPLGEQIKKTGLITVRYVRSMGFGKSPVLRTQDAEVAEKKHREGGRRAEFHFANMRKGGLEGGVPFTAGPVLKVSTKAFLGLTYGVANHQGLRKRGEPIVWAYRKAKKRERCGSRWGTDERGYKRGKTGPKSIYPELDRTSKMAKAPQEARGGPLESIIGSWETGWRLQIVVAGRMGEETAG